MAPHQSELAETAQWVRRCREVARGWDLSEDIVRRQYTLDLYSAGHDLAAQEVRGGEREGRESPR